MNNNDIMIILQTDDAIDSSEINFSSCNDSVYCHSLIFNSRPVNYRRTYPEGFNIPPYIDDQSELKGGSEFEDNNSSIIQSVLSDNLSSEDRRLDINSDKRSTIVSPISYNPLDKRVIGIPQNSNTPSNKAPIDFSSKLYNSSDCMTSCSTRNLTSELDADYYERKCESQPKQSTMRLDSNKIDLDELISRAGSEYIKSPELATSDGTRRVLSICREIYIAIIGAQLVYVLTSLLFGNIASAIIVSLLAVQSTFCHCDGRPIAYVVNGILSLSIGILVLIALLKDVSGLEPFKTDPVLRSLSYVYVPLCIIFTILSFFLACSFRRLHHRERKAIINATNRLLGNKYNINDNSFTLNKTNF